jgi:hypothetical protein
MNISFTKSLCGIETTSSIKLFHIWNIWTTNFHIWNDFIYKIISHIWILTVFHIWNNLRFHKWNFQVWNRYEKISFLYNVPYTVHTRFSPMKYSYMKFLMFEILHMKIISIQILLWKICKLIYQLGNWKFNTSI